MKKKKIQCILKKYRFSIPNDTILSCSELRVLCREYRVRYRKATFSNYKKIVEKINKNIQYKLKTRQIIAIMNKEECPICYETFTYLKYPKYTYCMHAFCSDCLSIYLKHNHGCPLCRDKYTTMENMDIVDMEINIFFEKSIAFHFHCMNIIYIHVLLAFMILLFVYVLYEEMLKIQNQKDHTKMINLSDYSHNY